MKAATSLSEQAVWEALKGVPDPEIPVVDVVELGIVRSVEVSKDQATISMTPTFSGCPALQLIREEIAKAVRELGFKRVEVKTVLSPPWTTDWITPEAKEKLRRYGIAPPGPASGLVQLEPEVVRCPRCGAADTSVKNTFGPTLCKAIYVCNACREPFEAFKRL